MSAYVTLDIPRHAAEDGMIATLGLLPGTWIGKVDAIPLYEKACDEQCAATRPRPRPPAFRGCFRSLKMSSKFGGKRGDATTRRSRTISRQRLDRHETRMEHNALEGVGDLFQDLDAPLEEESSADVPRRAPVPKQPMRPVRPPSSASSGARADTPWAFPGELSLTRVGPSNVAAATPQTRGSSASKVSSSRCSTRPARVTPTPTKPPIGGIHCRETVRDRAYARLKHQPPPHNGPWQSFGNTPMKQATKADDLWQEAVDEEANAVWMYNAFRWGKTRKIPKWDFCRVSGPWANRMRSGSVMNYRQWGPDGPLWTLADGK